jgi:hypothetical protein
MCKKNTTDKILSQDNQDANDYFLTEVKKTECDCPSFFISLSYAVLSGACTVGMTYLIMTLAGDELKKSADIVSAGAGVASSVLSFSICSFWRGCRKKIELDEFDPSIGIEDDESCFYEPVSAHEYPRGIESKQFDSV